MNDRVPPKEEHEGNTNMVCSMGVNEHRFEITLRSKGGVGSDTRIVTHEVNVGQVFNGWCECSSNKPKLLHVPCSHLLAALSQVGVGSSVYVSPFYLKENVVLTWTGEFRGFSAHSDFIVYDRDMPICLPPMMLLRHPHGKGGRPQTRRIHNDMDEAEVGGLVRRCSECDEYGHKAKDFPHSNRGDAGAGPSTGSIRGRVACGGQAVHRTGADLVGYTM
jgi:hypothetical protein